MTPRRRLRSRGKAASILGPPRMRCARGRGRVPGDMYARAVDDASARLRDLRREEWEQLGLGASALALAILATQVHQELAVPLFLGGIVIGALGIRALWRHWDLVERLSGEREAYVIAEVLSRAMRETTMARRRSFAARVRGELREQPAARIGTAAAELEALANELEDPGLGLDPASAVACQRLLTDLDESPLLNPSMSAADLRGRVGRIRSGFSPVASGSGAA